MSEDFTPPADLIPADIPQNSAESGEINNEDNQELSDTAAAIKRMEKVMVDGIEEEVDIDALKKAWSHNKGADKRMTEAARLKADAQKIIDLIKADPVKARRELDESFNEEEFLTNRLAELINEKALTPAQRQARDDALELQKWRAEKKAQQDEIQAKQLEGQLQLDVAKLDEEFAQAFNEVGLPKTDEARKRLATLMLNAEESNQKIPVTTLAKIVLDEMIEERIALFRNADDDSFEKLLGSELLSRAQKIALRKVKSPGKEIEPGVVKRDGKTSPAKKTAQDFLGDLGMF